jgi:hypothetical protein
MRDGTRQFVVDALAVRRNDWRTIARMVAKASRGRVAFGIDSLEYPRSVSDS